MNKTPIGAGLLLAGLLALTLNAQDTAPPAEAPAAVVGTFDSRAVAVAYVRSATFSEYLSAQQADLRRALERARAAGDEALAAELDALGPAMQARIHRQGFGTAPVHDVLARIEDRLPTIATEAGVDLIVSKWELDYLRPGAETVDVTDLLVAEFGPSEATLKTVRELVAQDPVPDGELRNDH